MGLGSPAAPKQHVVTVEVQKELPQKRSDEGIAAVKAVCVSNVCGKFSFDGKGWMACAACKCRQVDHKLMVASSSCPEGHWGPELGKEFAT